MNLTLEYTLVEPFTTKSITISSQKILSSSNQFSLLPPDKNDMALCKRKQNKTKRKSNNSYTERWTQELVRS